MVKRDQKTPDQRQQEAVVRIMKRIFPIIICALALGSCSIGYPSFYTLSAEGPSPDTDGIRIGVGPVILAEYMDRPNLVVQTSANQMEVAERHLWAGDLDNSISRVLSVNLGRQLNTGNFRTYPWLRDSEVDYQVAMDIREFVAGSDGYAHLEANWRVYSLPGRKLNASKTFIDKEPIKKESFESMVAAQSELLRRLSVDIAKNISKR